MHREGIIFDLDGTLLDTLADIAAAMNRVLREHGLPEHETDDYLDKVGWGLEELVRRSLPPEKQDPLYLARCYEELRCAYESDPVEHTRPYDGVCELLDRLREERVALAVLSNKHDDLVRTIVAEVFSEAYFSVVRGAREGAPKKPDPEVACEIADSWGVAPAQIVLLGDSPIDVETARAAGMTAAAVTWGFSTREQLVRTSPDVLIDTPNDILSWFDFGRSHRRVMEGNQ